MKTPNLLLTLSTMTLALACAALLVVADAASARGPVHPLQCAAPLQLL